MNTCSRFNRWIRGCNFEPRFDTQPPNNLEQLQGSTHAVVTFMELASQKTYVGDVCTSCGHFIRRKEVEKSA